MWRQQERSPVRARQRRPLRDQASGLAEEGDFRRQACVASGRSSSGKAREKLPTAMETSERLGSLLGSKVDSRRPAPSSQGGLQNLAKGPPSAPRGPMSHATLTGTRPP